MKNVIYISTLILGLLLNQISYSNQIEKYLNQNPINDWKTKHDKKVKNICYSYINDYLIKFKNNEQQLMVIPNKHIKIQQSYFKKRDYIYITCKEHVEYALNKLKDKGYDFQFYDYDDYYGEASGYWEIKYK